MQAELTPARIRRLAALHGAAAELASTRSTSAVRRNLFFPSLGSAVFASWRYTTLSRDIDCHVLGFALLLLPVSGLWPGQGFPARDTTSPQPKAAPVRWGLATAFVIGSCAIAALQSARSGKRVLESPGFAVQPSRWLRGWLLGIFAVAAGVVVALSANVAEIGLSQHEAQRRGPAEESIFGADGYDRRSNPCAAIARRFRAWASLPRPRAVGRVRAHRRVGVRRHAHRRLTRSRSSPAGKPLDGSPQTLVVLIARSQVRQCGRSRGLRSRVLRARWRTAHGAGVSSGPGMLALICFHPLGDTPAGRLPRRAAPGGVQTRRGSGLGGGALVGCAVVGSGTRGGLVAGTARGWCSPSPGCVIGSADRNGAAASLTPRATGSRSTTRA